MRPLDAEILNATALVVDANATSRSVLVSMLRECGISKITQTPRALEARKVLELRRFDIVVCEYHFPDEPMTGQDLLDDLRLANVLPLSSVVVMISSEAGYAHVAEAAEAALDAYLIKPHTEQALRERLVQARLRKRSLQEIIRLVENDDFLAAAELCQARFETHGPYWVHAARIGAELWLRLAKPHAAQKMFEAIMQVRALPWARLGVARTQYEAGGAQLARRTLESLLEEQPGYADAYDVMGRVLLDQGEPDQAIEALRRAAGLTPGCVGRLVKLGLLAFYYGNAKEATDALQKASRLGLQSKVFDLQGLVLLGALQFDAGDGRALSRSLDSMAFARQQAPESPRLRRFEDVLNALVQLQQRSVPEAIAVIRRLLSEVQAPNFEFEAACNLLMLLSRLHLQELRLEEAEHNVGIIGRRFAVSRITLELLVRSVQGQAGFERALQQAYGEITAAAEEAVSHTVEGQPQEAVRLLLEHAQRTFNAKLIDLATHTLERHRQTIDDAAALGEQANELHRRYRSYGTQVHLSRADDPRTMASAARSR
ncbi:response regulator [Aquabacterium sp. A7-Y]|uniref:response regulator n=1 Tax=Aquabacterium sp. A7-Y TaxID=1349605 RepID=UPI00223D2675|nr:response regulator [Aquabacterium sp. A7-Y]MCW7538652.1 response regulator [Aquabacterium sp. A7-Y]